MDLDFKIPPSAIELENAVLGAMMLERDRIPLVIHKLTDKHFYKPENQLIFNSIKHLFTSGGVIDLLTVSQDLKSKGVLELAGGAFEIGKLTDKVSNSANIEFHAAILIQKHAARELIRLCSESAANGFNEDLDPFQSINDLSGQLYMLVNQSMKKQIMHFNQVVNKVIKEMQNPITADGIQSGFREFDSLLGGFQPSDLHIIAARPGMGKTAFMGSIAQFLSVPCGIFSLEMSAEQLVKRFLSSKSGINSNQFRRSTFDSYDWDKIHKLDETFLNLPIQIDDSAALSLIELNAKARQMVSNGAKLIFVDYLQLVKGVSKHREQEVAEVSRGLKNLAKDLNIPVVAFAQLNRGVEDKSDKRPTLSDLRESGEIENAADSVTFIVRPEYYKIDNFNYHSHNVSSEGVAIIDVAKNRHGGTGDFLLGFDKNTVNFYNK